MVKEVKNNTQTGVDKGLVAMFIKMTPEERLLANDNVCRSILELRDAYKRRKRSQSQLKQNP